MSIDAPVPDIKKSSPEDKTKRLLIILVKIYFIGFFTPILLLFVYFLFTPAILVSHYAPNKADAVLIEIRDVPHTKSLQNIAELYRKTRITKVFLIFDTSIMNRLEFGIKDNFMEDCIQFLERRGVPREQIHLIRVNGAEEEDNSSFARLVARTLVSKNISTLILQTNEFNSAIMSKLYKKTLAPLNITVYTLPEKSSIHSGSWYKSIDGIELVISKHLKNIHYLIMGYY